MINLKEDDVLSVLLPGLESFESVMWFFESFGMIFCVPSSGGSANLVKIDIFVVENIGFLICKYEYIQNPDFSF